MVKRAAGAGVGIGMLRGGGFLPTKIKKSKFQSFKVSWFSWVLGFLVSCLLALKLNFLGRY